MTKLTTTRTEEHTMNRRRATIVGALALAAAVVLPATTAGADGGNGTSYCSNSGPPTGEFAGDIYDGSTYGNAGEVVAWFSHQGIKPGPWGHTVRAFCDPQNP